MIRLQPPPSPRRICAGSKRCAGPAPASSASRTAPGPSRPTISSAPRPMSGCRRGSARSLIQTLSALPLDRQVGAEGATWLDRELIADAPTATRNAGFGRDVRDALGRRRQWLIEQELARREQDQIIYRANMLALLRRRELARVGAQLSARARSALCRALSRRADRGHLSPPARSRERAVRADREEPRVHPGPLAAGAGAQSREGRIGYSSRATRSLERSAVNGAGQASGEQRGSSRVPALRAASALTPHAWPDCRSSGGRRGGQFGIPRVAAAARDPYRWRWDRGYSSSNNPQPSTVALHQLYGTAVVSSPPSLRHDNNTLAASGTCRTPDRSLSSVGRIRRRSYLQCCGGSSRGTRPMMVTH